MQFRHKDGNEIGIDEAGRGPLFGRVYTAAVMLPDGFDYSKIKDSKKFSNTKKRKEVAEMIKESAIWAVTYSDECIIDKVNILQATMQSMHQSITTIFKEVDPNSSHLIIDGNYFKPYTYFDKEIKTVPYTCFEKGDNTYASIAAASILAKVSRDEYIDELCKEYPYLIERYGLDSNKGYGTKRHMDGIKDHGITEWHRKSFAPCKLH